MTVTAPERVALDQLRISYVTERVRQQRAELFDLRVYVLRHETSLAVLEAAWKLLRTLELETVGLATELADAVNEAQRCGRDITEAAS